MRQIKTELECINRAAEGILQVSGGLDDDNKREMINKFAETICNLIEILKEMERFSTISR